ncbi:hypothetical protein JCM13267_11170 [Howardella ureilytica]
MMETICPLPVISTVQVVHHNISRAGDPDLLGWGGMPTSSVGFKNNGQQGVSSLLTVIFIS